MFISMGFSGGAFLKRVGNFFHTADYVLRVKDFNGIAPEMPVLPF